MGFVAQERKVNDIRQAWFLPVDKTQLIVDRDREGA